MAILFLTQENTFEIRENVFFFSFLKLFSFLRYSNFKTEHLKFHEVIKCLSMKQDLLSKLGNKHRLVMKFSQFMQHSKGKKLKNYQKILQSMWPGN